MNKKRIQIIGLILALIAVAAVFLVEQVVKPGYWVKSTVKLTVFIGTAILYSALSKQKFTETVRLRLVKNLKPLLICMLVFFVGTAMLFFLLKDQINLTNIRESLIAKENLTKENCLFVFSYIILFNSFLEESFFRGFVFQLFENQKVGALVSAVLFSLYHIGIFITWFNPFIFMLCIFGLIAVGVFLQWLSWKYNSIVPGYITHACANIAINIIGALLIFEVIG